MTAQYVYLIIFACVGYLIATDESVAKAFFYITKILQNQFTIFWWWLKNNPRNPIVKYLIHRRSLRLAKQLAKELNK
jgi:hypothetical protein